MKLPTEALLIPTEMQRRQKRDCRSTDRLHELRSLRRVCDSDCKTIQAKPHDFELIQMHCTVARHVFDTCRARRHHSSDRFPGAPSSQLSARSSSVSCASSCASKEQVRRCPSRAETHAERIHRTRSVGSLTAFATRMLADKGQPSSDRMFDTPAAAQRGPPIPAASRSGPLCEAAPPHSPACT